MLGEVLVEATICSSLDKFLSKFKKLLHLQTDVAISVWRTAKYCESIGFK